VSGTVRQYAARYFELPRGIGSVTVRLGPLEPVDLVSAPQRADGFWWSNRGDGGDSRLTKLLDLRSATKATLRFSAWFDLERDYDYAYVSVSADGGRTWTTLPGRHTTEADPNGANYGSGYTGKSGGANPGWVDEEIDLGLFVGRQVLLRFETVTDDAYNGGGFCVDDIAIPELGWNGAASERDWTAEGFIWVDSRVRQRMTIRAIARTGAAVRVLEMSGQDDEPAELRLPEWFVGADRIAVAVVAHTPITIAPARFELEFASGA
jgi:hypothetical protein